jgi:DNA (cytosine-5)-methyltransferase 1
VTTKARWALINGDRMRMLTVPENCAAMGFPKGYQLPAQTHQAIHLLGNAVCPPVARDVISALAAQL